MSQLNVNTFVKSFVEEAVRKMKLHEILDSETNKQCHTVYDYPVSVSTEIDCFAFLDTRISFYPSRFDAEEYIRKTQLLLESLHGVGNFLIFEISGCCERIEFAYYSAEFDSNVVTTGLDAFFSKSFINVRPIEKDEYSYWVYSYTPLSPFYMALSPPDFVLSPLNAIVEILATLEEKAHFQVLMMPMMNNVGEMVGEAIDADWKSRLPSGEGVIPPSVSVGRFSEREKYKASDWKNYANIVVRFLCQEPNEVIQQKLTAFISSYTYGRKGFKLYNYRSGRFTSKQRGFVVNSLELSSICHPPWECLENYSIRDCIAYCPPGQIPIREKKNTAVLGNWVVGDISIPIHEPVVRLEGSHCHLLGKPRTGKSTQLERITHDAIEMNDSSIIVIDGHGDLYYSIANNIKPEHKDRVILLDFSLPDHIPQLTLRENFRGDPGVIADEITESMKGSMDSAWFGPRMIHCLLFLSYGYSVVPSLVFSDLRTMVSQTKKGKNLCKKIAEQIDHPIVADFFRYEIQEMTWNQLGPVIARLERLFLHYSNYKFFSQEENKLDLADIMDSNKILLVNLASGKLGTDRCQILGSLLICIITSILFSRIDIPFHKRMLVRILLDEFYLFATQAIQKIIAQSAKFNSQLILSNQEYEQLEPEMRESSKLAWTKLFFNPTVKDAKVAAEQMKDVEPQDLLDLKPFQAYALVGDNTYKVQTAKPINREGSCFNEILQCCVEQYYAPLKPEQDSKSGTKTYDTI